MKRNVFISFLGTSDYEPCRYVINGDYQLDTRFVQEAIISYSCSKWTKNDRVYIFTTDDAREKNWHSLKEALKIHNLAPGVESIWIPDEISEKTMWDVFEIIYNKLIEGDQILFDITHGFRSSPMLLLTLINYSSFLKNTTVTKIYYGAFTAMKTLNVDHTPVWDLTGINLLHEWTIGANEFINFGQPERIAKLAEKSAIPYILDAPSRAEGIKISRYSKSICHAADIFSTVRGLPVSSADLIEKIITDSREAKKAGIVKPLQPFMAKTIAKFSGYKPGNVLNFLPAVKYCIKHNLIQQGITFLQEGIVSYVLYRLELPWSTEKIEENNQIRSNREMVSSTLNYLYKQKRNKSKDWDWKNWPETYIQKILKDEFCRSIANSFNTIAEYRNDINHAGYICPKEPKQFKKMLENGYANLIQILKSQSF